MVEFEKIYELRDKIVQHFHPQKIILFGSYAYGNPNDDSDVDLLVIMPVDGRNSQQAIKILNTTDPRFAIDLLVRTPEQVQTRMNLGDFFIREIVNKGKVLYESVV